ncbi:MAG: hypothetical protein K8R58_01765, partial [Bacteroidales bacterium]|nr:hypothetical protein [Bacteroidales bacterium]
IEKELADLKESNEKYILAKDELDKELVDLKQEKINIDISTEEIKEKLDIETKTRKQIEDELRKLLDELKGN